MEAFSELAQSVHEALYRNYFLTIAIVVLVLALTLYVYFFPTSIAEYFKDPTAADKKLPVIGRV
jgi:hypothetical protein